jgi:hypothetical protein
MGVWIPKFAASLTTKFTVEYLHDVGSKSMVDNILMVDFPEYSSTECSDIYPDKFGRLQSLINHSMCQIKSQLRTGVATQLDVLSEINF